MPIQNVEKILQKYMRRYALHSKDAEEKILALPTKTAKKLVRMYNKICDKEKEIARNMSYMSFM